MEPDGLPPFDDDDFDDPSTEERRRTRSRRLARFGKRLLDRGGELGKGVLETSDRAKSEMVRMVAREVRNYLDELGLKEDLLGLATSHSLEVSVSLSLKPLPHGAGAPAPAPPGPESHRETAPPPQRSKAELAVPASGDPDLADEPDP